MELSPVLVCESAGTASTTAAAAAAEEDWAAARMLNEEECFVFFWTEDFLFDLIC